VARPEGPVSEAGKGEGGRAHRRRAAAGADIRRAVCRLDWTVPAWAASNMHSDDLHKAQTAVDGLVDHARKHGTKLQYARALATQTPGSPIYSLLESRLPQPAAVYTRLAEIHEAEEAATVKRQIDERRSRLGATLEGTTTEVKNEVYGASPLEDIYQNIVDWTSDDALRRECEEKLLQRAYDTLLVLPAGKKEAKREKVIIRIGLPGR
jgi:hypothetical protein